MTHFEAISLAKHLRRTGARAVKVIRHSRTDPEWYVRWGTGKEIERVFWASVAVEIMGKRRTA